MKTRLELLEENFYVQTLGKVLQHEINIRIMKKRVGIDQPNNPAYQNAQKELPKLKASLKSLNNLLAVIVEMIKEEKGKNGKKV